jgi:hypothetical protein
MILFDNQSRKNKKIIFHFFSAKKYLTKIKIFKGKMSIWLSKQLITGGHAQKLLLPLCAVNMTLRLVRHTHNI